MVKCDVIIPVYNAPEYVEMCVFALYNNTDINTLGTVYLIDDKSNEITSNMLDNLQKKYKDKKLKVIHNEENLGFIKNVNKGFALSKEKYVLLLNTDCFVANRTIEKLISHMENNKKIGLICPMCSNAANLTIEMFPGFSYMQMDKLLEKKFSGINYDACTVVGNCLMISQECIKKTGYFDEIYGMGYGDETDYQFQAMSKGFEAKVALDTYVFHKAEMSFNTSNKKRSERLEKNRKIFFDRWETEYYKLLSKYEKNDPVKFILDNLTDEDKIPKLDFVFVLPQMGKGAGGVIYINELVNYLSILGVNIGMLNLYNGLYNEIMIFNPITPLYFDKFEAKYLIATIFDSTFFAKKMAEEKNAKMIYFSQGYEFMFLEGTKYGEVESSFKIADYVLTISDFLKNSYKKLFDIDALKISNAIDYNMLHKNKVDKHKRKGIFMNLRSESLKGGFILYDIIKKITISCNDVDLYVVDNSVVSDFCVNNNSTINLNVIKGPVSRNEIHSILSKCDILVDSSLSEGFGLLPLEAMTSGVVPVVSNALGNLEYCVNNENSVVVDNVNNPDVYVDAVVDLLNDNKKLDKMKKNAIKTSEDFDFEKRIFDYKECLDSISSKKVRPINYKLTDNDQVKLDKYLYSDSRYRRIINSCKRNYDVKSNTRKHNLKVLLKEFVKANLFILKQTYRTIKNKDYHL